VYIHCDLIKNVPLFTRESFSVS